MGEEERREFLVWYKSQKSELYDNRRVLENYCQADVTVLRQACRVIRREFMHIGNKDVFVESIKIASAGNKFLRKGFLQPDNIVLILTVAYTCNKNYGMKALMWLLQMEQTDGVKILHSRNGRE